MTNLTSFDFTQLADGELSELASSIRGIVADEKALVNDASALGAPVVLLWKKSLQELSEQADHLDSITESLSLECDVEASLLLGIAAMQVK